MTKVKLNLQSGSEIEREIVTAFNYSGVKYIIFDGESTGSMGLPIILVSKESFGKVVGITDAEEWKNTKECLKQIIAGEKVDYAKVDNVLKADDIYYRQLTLPIASFDILKSSYVAPTTDENPSNEDQKPLFEPITPEEVAGGTVVAAEPVAPASFTTPNVEPVAPASFAAPSVDPIIPDAPAPASEPAEIPTIPNAI